MPELTEWLCTECGRKHEFATDPDERKVCNDCGAFLKRANAVPLTPNSDLRELINQWRDEYDGMGEQVANLCCANDLEALIESDD